MLPCPAFGLSLWYVGKPLCGRDECEAHLYTCTVQRTTATVNICVHALQQKERVGHSLLVALDHWVAFCSLLGWPKTKRPQKKGKGKTHTHIAWGNLCFCQLGQGCVLESHCLSCFQWQAGLSPSGIPLLAISLSQTATLSHVEKWFVVWFFRAFRSSELRLSGRFYWQGLLRGPWGAVIAAAVRVEHVDGWQADSEETGPTGRRAGRVILFQRGCPGKWVEPHSRLANEHRRNQKVAQRCLRFR